MNNDATYEDSQYSNRAGGMYNDAQMQNVRPEHDPQRFYGLYRVDDSENDDWYEKFFSKNADRGFVKVLDNVDSDGAPLGQTALFRCPCPHAETLNIPINQPNKHPCWNFSQDSEGRMTLSPSIQQHQLTSPNGEHINCNSHFFIRNGMVEWC